MPEPWPLTRGGGWERARPKEDFIGRDHELNLMAEVSDLLQKGFPTLTLVTGLPGVGKTELMKQAVRGRWELKRDILSLYARPLPGTGNPVFLLAKEIVSTMRDGSPQDRGPWGDVRYLREVDENGPVGILLQDLSQSEGAGDSEAKAVSLVRLAESLAERHKTRLVIFADDGHLLPPPKAMGRALSACKASLGSVSWVLGWRAHPHYPSTDPDGFGFRVVRLGPLADSKGQDLLSLAMARAGVVIAEECRLAAFLLGGIPLLLWEAAAAARLCGGNGFHEMDAFLRFYLAEQSHGFLYEYHRSLLGGEPCEDGPLGLLEVLNHLVNRGPGPVDEATLAWELLKGKDELREILGYLRGAGLLRSTWGKISLNVPKTFADFCRIQSRRHLEGCSEEELLSRLLLEKRQEVHQSGLMDTALQNLRKIKGLIRSWHGQSIPRSLVDFRRYAERLGGKPSPEAREIFDVDESRVKLPVVVDVWSESFPGTAYTAPYFFDLLAIAPSEEGKGEQWVAVEIRLRDKEVTSAMVEDFYQRSQIFQTKAGLRSSDIHGWIISGGTFSAEAVKSLRQHGLWSSGPQQLGLMAEILGPEGSKPLSIDGSGGASEDAFTFQMVIPARPETELVAARAVEQISKGLPLDEAEIGKVKTALVEACLNAFEHGQSEDRHVYLTVHVRPERLEIEVFNKGYPFAPKTIATPDIEEKIGSDHKRGWGLSIIKELMDSMEFIQEKEGTRLRMVKLFTQKPAGNPNGRNK